MTLIPEQAAYAEQVQAFFLAFRGSGVAISALDTDLLLDWADRGVPYDVVCRGIRLAAEAIARDARPGDGRPRSLRGCKRQVEAEFRRYLGRAAGRGGAPPKAPEQVARDRRQRVLSRIRKAVRLAPGPEHACAYRVGLDAVQRAPESDPAALARAVGRADEAIALVYARALPWAARRALVREARDRAGPRPPGATPRGRRDALRAHLVAVARQRGELAPIG